MKNQLIMYLGAGCLLLVTGVLGQGRTEGECQFTKDCEKVQRCKNIQVFLFLNYTYLITTPICYLLNICLFLRLFSLFFRMRHAFVNSANVCTMETHSLGVTNATTTRTVPAGIKC